MAKQEVEQVASVLSSEQFAAVQAAAASGDLSALASVLAGFSGDQKSALGIKRAGGGGKRELPADIKSVLESIRACVLAHDDVKSKAGSEWAYTLEITIDANGPNPDDAFVTYVAAKSHTGTGEKRDADGVVHASIAHFLWSKSARCSMKLTSTQARSLNQGKALDKRNKDGDWPS